MLLVQHLILINHLKIWIRQVIQILFAPIYFRETETGSYDYALNKVDDNWLDDGYIKCKITDLKNEKEFEAKSEDALNYYTDFINDRVNKITLYNNKTKKVIASIDFAYPDIYDPENSTISQQINEINQLKFDSTPLDFDKQEFLPAKKEKGRYILQEMYRKEVEAERQDRIKNLRRKQGLER
ncbi:hypothetical protein AAC432_05015 [Lactobacillus jensenii]|uniref:hypothetical protein n=1 Tax=Lactobacillus jensenii TaxID=109790 RepID=UPI00311FF3B9